MGTPESAVETRPKSVIVGIALIGLGSLMVLMGSMAHSAGLEGIGGAFIVLATMVCSALLLALAAAGLILFAFRHYP
jgi:hypothetical protein